MYYIKHFPVGQPCFVTNPNEKKLESWAICIKTAGCPCKVYFCTGDSNWPAEREKLMAVFLQKSVTLSSSSQSGKMAKIKAREAKSKILCLFLFTKIDKSADDEDNGRCKAIMVWFGLWYALFSVDGIAGHFALWIKFSDFQLIMVWPGPLFDSCFCTSYAILAPVFFNLVL